MSDDIYGGLHRGQSMARKRTWQLVCALIDLLITERDRARGAKDYETADRIRKRLTELGVKVKDTPIDDGPPHSWGFHHGYY